MAEIDSSTTILNELEDADGISVLRKNMKIDGNLQVEGQVQTKNLKIVGEDYSAVMQTAGDAISFKKAVEFIKPVQFNNGRTLIGIETTYNSAYVGSPTIQAGERLVVGDSLFKIDAASRKIIADTFKMTLARLDADNIISKKSIVDLEEAKKIRVSEEIIGKNIFADTIKTNNLVLDNVVGKGLRASESLTTQDLTVQGSAEVQNALRIMGRGAANGAALTVNGGQIIANWGIESHTRNNRFQCMEIMGGGQGSGVCFKVDKDVDSLFEGDVTIEDANLVLDKSRLVADDIVVTPLNEVVSDEPMSGVQLTTKGDWDTYESSMVSEVQTPEACADEEYDPVAEVQAARARNEENYENAQAALKDILNPITYLMEQNNPNIPKKFNVKSGVHRLDNSGNALFRNVVSERGKFSRIEAYDFKVNKLNVDKLVLTSVASNVVDTDNLLKSRGIAEFSGAVNVADADVFVNEGSKVNVAEGSEMNFASGSTLRLRDGASLEMGSDTSMKMSGDVELDLNKLVFVDSNTGRKYRIFFRDAHVSEGGGVVMNYAEVKESEVQEGTRTARGTALDARELDSKLKKLGL